MTPLTPDAGPRSRRVTWLAAGDPSLRLVERKRPSHDGSIVGRSEARPADGLAIDFVVEADRGQLSEIVQRVRDGPLRAHIGTVSTLDDAISAFSPIERAAPGEDDHSRSPVSQVRPVSDRHRAAAGDHRGLG